MAKNAADSRMNASAGRTNRRKGRPASFTTQPPSPYDPIGLIGLPEDLARRPLVAALLAGQLFNRHRFHFQAACFFAGRLPTLERLADEFRRVARVLVSPNRRDGLEQLVREHVQDLHDWLYSAAHVDLLEEVRDQIRMLPLVDRLETNLAEIRGQILHPLLARLADMRRAVLEQVDEETRLAFRLGEAIDEGVCPRDAYLDFDEPPAAETDSPTPDPFALPAPGTAAGDTWRPPPVRLASRAVAPGDIPPCASWWEDVMHLWSEIPLPVEVRDVCVASGNGLGRERVFEVVRDLGRRAAEGLIFLAACRRPTRSLAGRLRILDVGSMEVLLDGRGYVVEHRAAFSILKRLIDADGDMVDTAVINDLPGCKGRIDKIVQKLPPDLRTVVVGNTGGGGYYLRLPPESA